MKLLEYLYQPFEETLIIFKDIICLIYYKFTNSKNPKYNHNYTGNLYDNLERYNDLKIENLSDRIKTNSHWILKFIWRYSLISIIIYLGIKRPSILDIIKIFV